MKAFSKWITTYPKTIVTIWLIVVVVMGVLAIQLPDKLEGDGFSVDGDHAYVSEELSKTFDVPAQTIFVVFEQYTDETIVDVLAALQDVDNVQSIVSPKDSPAYEKDGIAYAMLHFDHTVTDFVPIVTELRDKLEPFDNVTLTGGPVINDDLNVASQNDLIKAETIGLPIALLVLVLAFGTLLASILPIVIGGITVITAFGILVLASSQIDMSIFVLNIVPMLGLALSIDFALLFINRYREENKTHDVKTSLQTAIQTAGRSIIFSAICVIIGLGAMVVIEIELFQNIALGGTIVVFLAVVASLTLLPAVMQLLGDKLNKWRIIRVKDSSSRWHSFASFVMKRPIVIVIVAIALLGTAMIPLKDIKMTIPSTDSIPTSFESRAAYDLLDDTFGLAKQSSVYVLAERPDGWDDAEAFDLIHAMAQKIEKDPLVERVDTVFSASQTDVATWNSMLEQPQAAAQLAPVQEAFIQGTQLFMPITIDADGASTKAQEFARHLTDMDLGVDFKIAGLAKYNQEIFDEMYNKIGYALAIIIVSTFFILMFAFKSVLIPIKAILMNILGLGATFGIIVYLFQYGHFGLPETTIALLLPVLVFCLVFGLSMDYEVFLISRIQEEYQKGKTNTKATIAGLVSTSKIITSAALIMIVITGAFAFTDVMPMKQIGVGIAIAIAIDATIIRLMLVPSLMKLFGEWNWWYFNKKR